MKLFENEYETVLADSPDEAKKVIQDCIDDQLTFEEIDDFKLCTVPPMVVYETMESIPLCVKNIGNDASIEMVEYSYYGSDMYYGVTISLNDWEKIADEYIRETDGAFVATSEF